MFVITKPVVDLWKEPQESCRSDYSHHPARLTQLLFGEPVHVIKKSRDYLFVEAILQENHTEQEGWHGYQGYIHKDDAKLMREYFPPTHVVKVPWISAGGKKFSFGTYLALDNTGEATLPDGDRVFVSKQYLRPLHTPFCRTKIIEDASHFLGAPYLWGGCSAHDKELVASVDCSGLIYLLYRAQGILIPRDAHPQTLKGRKIERHELKSGDLIYLSKESNPGRASHVLLYKDQQSYLESPQTGEKVSEKHFSTHFKEEGPLIKIHGRSERYFPTYLSFA